MRLDPIIITSAWQGNKQYIFVTVEIPENSTAIERRFNANTKKYEDTQTWANPNPESLFATATLGPNQAGFVEFVLQ